jgi:hypothetical protein
VGSTTIRFIAVVITVVWAASVIADIISQSYSPPVELHAIMGILAGALFGRDAVSKALDKERGRTSE